MTEVAAAAKEKSAPKNHIVRFQANQGEPLNIPADSFKVENDSIVFTTGGATTAVVRGAWVAVTQSA